VSVPPIDYEAVWATGLYLEERRASNNDVTIKRVDSSWQLAKITPDVSVQGHDGSSYSPHIMCIEDAKSRVLAFRITQEERVEENVALAVYDAVVSQRLPSKDGVAGLTWQIPATIIARVDVSQACCDACAGIQVDIVAAPDDIPCPELVHSDWPRDLKGRVLPEDHFARLFDNYLNKVNGYGPLSQRELQYREFAQLVGYNRDPAWQFPALRDFLPVRHGVVQDAAVECDGLHYADELLAYWPGKPATVRRSETSDATAWVYLDGEILCEAKARELRRRDGSYRTDVPER